MTVSKWVVSILLWSHAVHSSPPFWMWIDQSIPPQENFYLFANQNWIKQHPIPQAEAEWSIFNELKHEIDQELANTLKDLPKRPKLNHVKLFQQLHRLYQSGMDQQSINQANIQPLKPLLQQIHQFNPLFSTLAKLHRYNIPGFFQLYPYSSLHQPKRIIAAINQPNLILPDRNYYLHPSPAHDLILDAYRSYITQLLQNIGYSKTKARGAAKSVLEIETMIAKFSADRDFFRQPKNIDHVISFATFEQKYPNLPWSEYFSSLNFQPKFINVSNPHYFEQLNVYLPQLSQAQIQDYLIANLLVEMAEYLPDAYAQPACRFHQAIRGNQSCPKPYEQVMSFMNQYLGFALGDLYIATHHDNNTIPYVTEIYRDIRHSLKHAIITNRWLSTATKQKALLKLNKMTSRIGYPKPLNYQNLQLDSKIYLDNVLSARQFETTREWQKIGTNINPQEWDMPPQSINAYYSVAQNQINIPLGIMQSPFFNPKASAAANYGGIGVVIGHEIFHGFDDEGSQFDENGKLATWWTKHEWTIYQSHVKCIQAMFDRFHIPNTDLQVNGQLVSGEAIADLGGLSLSLDAYLHSRHFQHDQKIHGYSPLQQFFISFAQLWASNINPQEAYRKGLVDPHPPKIFRVNGSVQNCKAFYQAFSLPEPTNMCQFF